MKKGYDISKSKESIKEIKKNLEGKKKEVSSLEKQKTGLMEAIIDIKGSNIDVETKKLVEDALNRSLEANKEKGEKISTEIGKELKIVEEIRVDTVENIDEVTGQKEELNKKKSFLDKFGAGKVMDGAIKNLDKNFNELNEVKDDSIKVMKELENASMKASTL